MKNLRRRNTILMAAVSLFVLGILAVSGGKVAPASGFQSERPLIIAHQGGDGLRPGNTLVAFDHAAALGVDVLEMDAQLTAEGELVAIHDASVDRTTDGSGALAALSWDQIRTLDAGYHWPYAGDARPWRGRGVGIPKIETVLQRYPTLRFNIELKNPEAEAGEVLCALLQRTRMESRTLIASFHGAPLRAARAGCPNAAKSASRGEAFRFHGLRLIGMLGLHQPGPQVLQLPRRSLGLDLLSAKAVAAAHRRSILVHAWTINEPAAMQELIDAGVDGIITDYPDRLRRVLGERGLVSGVQRAPSVTRRPAR